MSRYFTKRADLFFLIGFIGLFLYIAARALMLDVTNDEAYSFSNIKHFWYAEALCTGNTHWLNSAAMWIAVFLKQESPFAIRWLSVLSVLLFCSAGFMWVRNIQGLPYKFLVFSFVFLNPYILDYFSLARGYAPGLALEVLALIFIYLATERQKFQFGGWALFCAGLSPLANFSFIYFFLAFAFLYFFVFYFRKGLLFLKSIAFYLDLVFCLAVFALVARAFVFMTECTNDVIGAGTGSFVEFISTLSHSLIDGKFPLSNNLHYLFSACMFTFITTAVFYGLMYGRQDGNLLFYYCSWLLTVMLAVIVFNHYCFDLVLPYNRSALFLFPATAVCVFYFWYEIPLNATFKKTVAVLVSFLLLLNFVVGINFRSTYDYSAQAGLKQNLDFLQSQSAKNVAMSRELYGSFKNYYKIAGKDQYLFSADLLRTDGVRATLTLAEAPLLRQSLSIDLKEYDYLLLSPPYNLKPYKNGMLKFEAIKMDEKTGVVVLKLTMLRRHEDAKKTN